jgi:hypothetical protein
MNHKRKRSKSRRAGCLLCKPHKANGAKDKNPARVMRQLQDDLRQAKEKGAPEGAPNF